MKARRIIAPLLVLLGCEQQPASYDTAAAPPPACTCADGLDGADGVEGAPGPTGPAGLDGQPGADGADGSPGAAGELGPTGPTGATGLPGAAGPVGPTGAMGPAGGLGPTGPAGPAGSDGLAGLDALPRDKGDVYTVSAQVLAQTNQLVHVEATCDDVDDLVLGGGCSIENNGFHLYRSRPLAPATIGALSGWECRGFMVGAPTMLSAHATCVAVD